MPSSVNRLAKAVPSRRSTAEQNSFSRAVASMISPPDMAAIMTKLQIAARRPENEFLDCRRRSGGDRAVADRGLQRVGERPEPGADRVEPDRRAAQAPTRPDPQP